MKKGYLSKTMAIVTGCLLLNATIGFCADLSLDQAIDMALSNDYDIKIAQKDKETADVALDGAKGAQKPSLTASSSFGISDIDNRGISRTNSNGISLSMPLYTGGKNELTIDKAKDEITAKELSLARTQETTELSTISAYYAILEAQKVVDVDTETVTNYQEHLNNVQALYAAGSIAKSDVLSTEVQLVNAQQTLVKDQNTYDVAVSTLKNIIKLKGEDALNLVDDAKYQTFDDALLDCIKYAKEHRKDLMQYQVLIKQAEKDVGIAKSGKKPTVNLSVSNTWDKQVLPSDDNHSLTAGVSASWDVFDGNVTEASIKKAEIAVEQAELNFAKQSDAIELDVRTNYLGMREAEKRFNSTQVAINKAEEDYFIAKEKYKAGAGLMLDIIDAQLALTTAKTNYIQAQYDYATYKAKLENVMGLSKGE
ncbi:MAG: outer membrane protein [Firmicutes bacterium]|nr:outer membrane protein [Bacillota bacterium]